MRQAATRATRSFVHGQETGSSYAFAREREADFLTVFFRRFFPFKLFPEGALLIHSSISEVIAMIEVPNRPLGRWMGNS